MLFLDFIGSVDNRGILDDIHSTMKNHLCVTRNVQCMNNEDEYHRYLKQESDYIYVAETAHPGVYIVYHSGEKVMVINFIEGEVTVDV